MTQHAKPLLLAALALAACGSGQSEAPPLPDTSPDAVPEASVPATSSAAAAAIPTRFIGVWDAETGTCNPASDLRLDIAPATIGFYESQGSPTRIAEGVDGSTVVELAMEGEGETWELTMSMSLSGTGAAERLIVQHEAQTGEPAPEPLRLKRCPA